ncbi:putative nuclease HARBI1 [Neodiprion lecontei]|uniref:Nuclease HARBI1 n=1 Tax=Neodiprion lecontei TaxID=441921 RepID=A0ABM3FIJ3_NEOLC|nr:putative nuclease HARBI1 [Neodiprion lecontei]
MMRTYGAHHLSGGLWNSIIIEENEELGQLGFDQAELFAVRATILTLHRLRLVNTLSAVKVKIFFTVQQSSIGDAGYPLEPWLLTPLANFPEDTRQHQYTQQLCKARSVVERFFGVFKSVWRCLSYQRVLMYEPAFAAKIVNACAVLHNMRVQLRLNNEDDEQLAPIAHPVENDVDPMAQRIQQQIMRERFPNFRDAEK